MADKGITRESSVLWKMVLSELWSDRKNLQNLADDLCLPLSEVEMLLSGILPSHGRPQDPKNETAPTLRVIK